MTDSEAMKTFSRRLGLTVMAGTAVIVAACSLYDKDTDRPTSPEAIYTQPFGSDLATADDLAVTLSDAAVTASFMASCVRPDHWRAKDRCLISKNPTAIAARAPTKNGPAEAPTIDAPTYGYDLAASDTMAVDLNDVNAVAAFAANCTSSSASGRPLTTCLIERKSPVVAGAPALKRGTAAAPTVDLPIEMQ